MTRPKKTILKNGIRLITVPLKDNPTVTVLVLVEAGSKYEAKEINGISHFLEHLCFKGTKKRPTPLELHTEIDKLGVQYNAFTGQEFTGYYAKGINKKFSEILDIVSDIYVNPIISKDEIEKEKGVIVDEINMYEDLPMRNVQEIFAELLYGNQPAGWSITGPKETVKNMTREQILDYRNKHYVADKTTVVIVGGGLDNNKIKKEVESKFVDVQIGKGGKMLKVQEKQKSPEIKVKYKETDQTHIVLGVRTYGQKSVWNTKLSMLGAVLGAGMSSRLFRRLRSQMGVGYYVNAGNEVLTDHGVFGISTGVANERVAEVVKAIVEELEIMKTELVSDKELKKVKDYLAGNIMLGLESSDSIAEYYGIKEILHRELKTPKEKIKQLQAVTARDIRVVARKIFKNESLNIALIGPIKDDNELKKVLKFKK